MNYIFVDTLGNDRTATKNNPLQAFKTIKKAFSVAKSGDHILIRGGNYVEHPLPLEPLELVAATPGHGAALVLENKENVLISGVGGPVINLSEHGTGVLIKDCKNIRIYGIEIKGKGPVTDLRSYAASMILCAGRNERLHIHDCVFRDGTQHGISHLLGPRYTNNCVFERNLFENGGLLNHPTLVADGAALAVGGSDNIFSNNTIKNWLRGIELEAGFPDNPTSRNIVTRNKILGCHWQSILVTSMDRRADLFCQNEISNNIIDGEYNKQGKQYSQTGIYIAGCIDLRILGNSITRIKDGIGILINSDWGECRDIIVSNNIVSKVDRTGIHLTKTPAPNPDFPVHFCKINDNIVADVGGRGCWINGEYLEVRNNTIRNCGGGEWEGVYEASEKPYLNTIKGNKEFGTKNL